MEKTVVDLAVTLKEIYFYNNCDNSVQPHSPVKWGGKLEKIGIHRHDVLMQTNTAEPMDASQQFCPNETCSARGQIGAGTIRIHSHQPQRYRCRMCQKTFSARRGTMMEGLRTPTELVVIVVIWLAYGCPVQGIVHAYGLDERTVADWQKRAGKHCQHVHESIVEQGKVPTSHVQADAHSSQREKPGDLDGYGH